MRPGDVVAEARSTRRRSRGEPVILGSERNREGVPDGNATTREGSPADACGCRSIVASTDSTQPSTAVDAAGSGPAGRGGQKTVRACRPSRWRAAARASREAAAAASAYRPGSTAPSRPDGDATSAKISGDADPSARLRCQAPGAPGRTHSSSVRSSGVVGIDRLAT